MRYISCGKYVSNDTEIGNKHTFASCGYESNPSNFISYSFS